MVGVLYLQLLQRLEEGGFRAETLHIKFAMNGMWSTHVASHLKALSDAL